MVGQHTPTQGKDAWEEIAKSYVGDLEANPTTPPTVAFIARANEMSPFSSATSILDNGCGPGPVTMTLLSMYGDKIPASAKLQAADFSPAMIKQLNQVREQKIAAGEVGWSRLETSIEDAQLLDGFENESFSHVLAGMMYMLVPDPAKALKATHRVLKPKGVIAFSSWQNSDWMELMSMIDIIRPGTNVMGRFLEAYRTVEGVVSVLDEAGFKDTKAEYVPTTMKFESQEQIVKFFIEKIPMIVEATKDYSPEELQRLEQIMVARLKEQHPEAPGKMNGMAVIGIGRK